MTRPPNADGDAGDETPRRIHKRKDVEKEWRKGTGRWRFAGDAEADSAGERKNNPRQHPRIRPEDERDALVVQTGGPLVLLQDGDEEFKAQARRSTTTENPDSTLVGIGDHVRYILAGDGGAVITHVYERRSVLARSSIDSRGYAQVLVANIDLVVVVAAATRELLRPGLIDRYLVSTAMGGLEAAVCINKMDLVDEEELAYVREVADVYSGAGYSVATTSCVTGEGIEDLHLLLRGKLSAFSGHSGVGKTSILRFLIPALEAKVQDLSEQSQRGVHTTTQSTLYDLPGGGYVADTPGIREFGLYFDLSDLQAYYPEFLRHAEQCRFPACTHTHEPGCAVAQAVEDGEIHPLRYRNYLQIKGSEEERNP